MNKKKNLLNLFTQDVTYNYHLIKTEEPNGHLIYTIKNGSNLDIDTLEFSPTLIVEELMNDCGVKVEKFAPSIFFTEEYNTEKLIYELNDKLSQESNFSDFINKIKDEYRILEVKDSLLYKKDPNAYNEAKEKEKKEHQEELLGDFIKQLNEQKKRREEALLKYNNNFIKLLKDQLESTIEYEKRDFNLNLELEKIISNLIDPETWIKVDDKPFICKIETISIEEDKINLFLTNNYEFYTATLRFDKTMLITENVIKIDNKEEFPKTKSDYDILIELFDVELDEQTKTEWEFKNEKDRIEYVIDYLVPIFKANKVKREAEFLEKYLKEEAEENKIEESDKFGLEGLLINKIKDPYDEDDEDDDNLSDQEKIQNLIDRGELKELEIDDLEEYNKQFNNNNNNNNMAKKTKPSDWYFDVFVPNDEDLDELEPPVIALSKDGSGTLDDSLGSHSLSQNVIDALNNAGIEGDVELMEAIWAVADYTRSKKDIIESMEKEGFIYKKGMLDNGDGRPE